LPIKFELSNDARLRRQYFQLRQACFRRELNIPEFDGSEDQHDQRGLLFLGHRDGQCIGGIRISSPQLCTLGPATELGIDAHQCCMWERFVLSPAVRNPDIFRDFCAALAATSTEQGYDHALVLSSRRNARFYRQCHSALGIGFEILGQVQECAQGEFAQLEHYLSVAYLKERAKVAIAA
tara:strand:+ start:10529 stop:11068 length:540 start_codon:yes stop_codon:yes gene_type:complete